METNMKICFRDDDISHETNLKRFKEIHSLFKKYKVPHTIALICKGIEKNPALIKYINDQKIEVQIHCYNHYDLTKRTLNKNLYDELKWCKEIILKNFNQTATILFPPWNLTSSDLEYTAWLHDLKVSAKKISIEGYLRGLKGDVVNFHSWAPECERLEEALIKYTQKVLV